MKTKTEEKLVFDDKYRELANKTEEVRKSLKGKTEDILIKGNRYICKNGVLHSEEV